MKYKKENEFYHNYPYTKVPYWKFMQRFVRGVPIERAIKPLSCRVKSERVTQEGRTCITCEQFKYWSDFANERLGTHGKTGVCLACRNEKKKVYRKDAEYRKKEAEYKQERRQTPRGQIMQKLDNLYYSNTKENRRILGSEHGLQNKIDWLHYTKGLSYRLLGKVYNLEGLKIGYIKTGQD